MTKLACIRGDNKGDEFALAEGGNVIGRTSECGVTLFDKKCSRSHCLIHKRGKYCTIEDNESTNGTFLNGKPLKPGKNVSLSKGNRIRIGRTVLEVSDKPVGNLLTQTATDVTAEMQSKQYDKLLSSAAVEASKNHDPKKSKRDASLMARIREKLFGR